MKETPEEYCSDCGNFFGNEFEECRECTDFFEAGYYELCEECMKLEYRELCDECTMWKCQLLAERAEEKLRRQLRWQCMRPSERYGRARGVIELAAEFIDFDLREKFLNLGGRSSRREPALLYLARTEEEEIEHLSEIIRSRIIRGECVGIVAPEKMLPRIDQAFGSDGVKTISIEMTNTETFDSLLAFDSVIIPFLSRKYVDLSEESSRRMLFNNVCGATTWVYLSAVAGEEIDEISKLKASKAVVVQQALDPITPEEIPLPPHHTQVQKMHSLIKSFFTVGQPEKEFSSPTPCAPRSDLDDLLNGL